MTKKYKTKSKAVAQVISEPPPTPSVEFPSLVQKVGLVCDVLEPDQIVLIPDIFSLEECRRYVKFIEGLPLQLTPPKKRGEADRVNYRISFTSVTFAQLLFSILVPHLPDIPHPAAEKRLSAAHSINSNIRLYKYTPSQHFGPHYDDSVRDPETGAKSEWTVLIYLTGNEDGVEGGETVFYKGQGRSRTEIRAPLRRGMALLHRHGHECMLHEGAPVLDGVKYVLRSDIMFMN